MLYIRQSQFHRKKRPKEAALKETDKINADEEAEKSGGYGVHEPVAHIIDPSKAHSHMEHCQEREWKSQVVQVEDKEGGLNCVSTGERKVLLLFSEVLRLVHFFDQARS